MGGAEAEHDRIVGRRGLELEVELPAEALPEGEPPRAVHARAERGVQDEVHPARLVEKALDNEALLRGHDAQRALHVPQVVDELPPRGVVLPHPEQPAQRSDGPVGERRAHAVPELGDRTRELGRASRRLADPERNRGRRAARVRDADLPALDAEDAVRDVAQLEDVARRALDREVLVERADAQLVRLEHDLVVGHVGDGAARRDGDEPRALPGADDVVHRVEMDVRPRRPRAVAKPSASICTTASSSPRVRSAYGDARPTSAKRAPRSQSSAATAATICWARMSVGPRGTTSRSSSPRRTHASRATISTSSSRFVGKKRPFGTPEMPWLARPIRCSAVAMLRVTPTWTTEIDVADVNPELERGGRDEDAEAPGLEAPLRLEAVLAREAAVVGADGVLSEESSEMEGDPLREPPRVHEDEGRPVLERERSDARVDLLPERAAGHRLQRRAGHLDGEVACARVTEVDDRARRVAGADEEARDRLDGRLRRGQADADERPAGQGLEPLEAEREVRTALVRREGVDLVDDDGADLRERAAPPRAREQDVERLGGGHEDVRRALRHPRPFARARVSCANGDADVHVRLPAARELLADPGERPGEVLLDVIAERLQRRHVDDVHLRLERALHPELDERVDRAKKRRQRLAGAGRRREERVPPALDRRPPARLHIRRSPEGPAKPGIDSGVERELHRPSEAQERQGVSRRRAAPASAGAGHAPPRR